MAFSFTVVGGTAEDERLIEVQTRCDRTLVIEGRQTTLVSRKRTSVAFPENCLCMRHCANGTPTDLWRCADAIRRTRNWKLKITPRQRGDGERKRDRQSLRVCTRAKDN